MATPRTRRRGGQAVKVVVTGPFAAGKTTLIRTISEITVLSTERGITDSTRKRKAETTVAMDFGRLTLAEDLVLYLFGTPGQRRFWFMWDDLCRGAIGAIVLVDTARLDEAFSPLDYFEAKGLPFIVCVNEFEGNQRFGMEDIANALALPPHVPIMPVDARNRESAKRALVRVTEYSLERLTATVSAAR